MNAKYEKDGNIEMWNFNGSIWYRETTYEAVVGRNPYLCDSDWDCNPEDEVVCEFVLDDTQSMSKEERNKLRQVVMELNHQLECGELETLIENIKHNV